MHKLIQLGEILPLLSIISPQIIIKKLLLDLFLILNLIVLYKLLKTWLNSLCLSVSFGICISAKWKILLFFQYYQIENVSFYIII